MRRTTLSTLAVGVAAALSLVLAGCSSSGGSSTHSPTATSSATTSVSSTPSSINSQPDAATLAAVTNVYNVFFDPKSTDAQVENSVQNGAALTGAVANDNHSQYQGHSGVKVLKVQMLSPLVAKVTFQVSLDGQVILPNASGYAVKEGGSWKLAATTFCQLINLEGYKTDLCKDPKETAFPTQ
jgi:hypothetical protein